MNELCLPIRGFCLNGYDEYIRLSIDEVFGYPVETSYGGGYGARGTIEIAVGGYRVESRHYFTTGELYMFKESLNICYKNLAGIAKLESTENELGLAVTFDRTGKTNVTGWFQERPDVDNKLVFEFKSDQTCIAPVIKELEAVQRIFGDMRGVKNI